MNESPLLYNVENFVGTLTINRPEKRNALSAELISLLLARLDEAEADATVRVVLITGAGEKAFCAGADLGGGVGVRHPLGPEPAGTHAREGLEDLVGDADPLVQRRQGPLEVCGGDLDGGDQGLEGLDDDPLKAHGPAYPARAVRHHHDFGISSYVDSIVRMKGAG